jgi:hypothetical protein
MDYIFAQTRSTVVPMDVLMMKLLEEVFPFSIELKNTTTLDSSYCEERF